MSIKRKIKAVISLLQPKRIVTANFTLRNADEYLADKVVLVTGGGSGFGYAIAKRFLQYGAKVVITGHNEQKLKKAVEALKSGSVNYLVWDLCDVTIAKKKMAEANTLFGTINVARNNAGVWTPLK